MTDFRDDLLKKIIDAITIENGNLALHDNILKTERWGYILLNEVLEKEGYQKKFNDLKYSWHSHQLTSLFIPPFNKIFKELKIEESSSFEKFKEKLEHEISEIKKHTREKKFVFLFPVRLKFPHPPKKIEINGISAEFKTFADIETLFSIQRLTDELREYEMNYSNSFLPNSYQYIEVTIYARNLWYAERKATKIAQLFISIISYIEKYGKMARSLMGPIQAISDLDLEIIFAFSGMNFEEFMFRTTKLGKTIHKLTERQIGFIDELSTLYTNSHPTVQGTIEDGFISYHAGIIESRTGYSFLNFWTASEIFCLKNPSVQEKEVIKRLQSPLRNKTDITKNELDRLYRLRNNIVHNADYSLATEYDRNIMQFHIEPFIEFFMNALSKFSGIEIEKIYRYLHDSDENLTGDKELIDFVMNLRKKK